MENTKDREEILTVRGIVIGENDRNIIKTLSLLMGTDESTTCKMIEMVMQSLSETIDNMTNLFRELEDMGIDLEGICESCTDRRTRHGSSRKTGEPEKGKYFDKWVEKHRPP